MSEISLAELGIQWKSSPRLWHTIPISLLPSCDIRGRVSDASGILFTLKASRPLGAGTFGSVDAFFCEEHGQKKYVAIKRPKHPNVNLLTEALFQWKLHNDLKPYGLSFCIPKVNKIFTYKPTGDVWFSMTPYEPNLLSSWCIRNLRRDGKTFASLILQIAMALEIIEDILRIDHRDLKVNNMLIIDETIDIPITTDGVKKKMTFPFRIVFIDFGFACLAKELDIKNERSIDFCPKEGRDMFQILVSIWRIDTLRSILEDVWGSWIRSKIGRYTGLAESASDLTWMYAVTDNTEFRAPLCSPNLIIKDCIRFLEC
jgi:serine/threonine protein kinase